MTGLRWSLVFAHLPTLDLNQGDGPCVIPNEGLTGIMPPAIQYAHRPVPASGLVLEARDFVPSGRPPQVTRLPVNVEIVEIVDEFHIC